MVLRCPENRTNYDVLPESMTLIRTAMNSMKPGALPVTEVFVPFLKQMQVNVNSVEQPS